MFENLQEKLQRAFKSLRGQARLSGRLIIKEHTDTGRALPHFHSIAGDSAGVVV